MIEIFLSLENMGICLGPSWGLVINIVANGTVVGKMIDKMRGK
jgi:hypothetical protein